MAPPGTFPRGGVVEAGLDAARNTVEGTVAAAYAVIDQYMSRGYAAASNHQRRNGADPMSNPDDRHDSRSRPYPGAGDPLGIWGAWNMWMEPWMQAMRFWTDSMNAPGGPGARMNPYASMMSMGGTPGMSVQVKSSRETTVTLDLAPGSDFQHLHVDHLYHSKDHDQAPLEGVRVDARPGHYTVRLEVSDEQAPGVYVGSVYGAMHQTLGELCVEIVGDVVPPSSGASKKRGKAKGGRSKGSK
jgi:hypothetical protein